MVLLRDPHAKIDFRVRPFKRSACKNRLIFVCGSLRGLLAKIVFCVKSSEGSACKNWRTIFADTTSYGPSAI